MNSELERIGVEAVVKYFEVLSRKMKGQRKARKYIALHRVEVATVHLKQPGTGSLLLKLPLTESHIRLYSSPNHTQKYARSSYSKTNIIRYK
jgi:hypothetical protein